MIISKSKYPRSILPLFIVLLVAILGFFFLRGDDSNPDFTLGGPVFSVSAEDIMVMHLTKRNQEYRFERNGVTGWTLAGDVSDFLDPKAMAELVSDLISVQSGMVLPGTEVDDKRYGFDGNDSMRLVVFATQGREFRLSLGVENPVTGGVYASGVGRPGCFTVGQGLRNKLLMLPVSVQEDQLLPAFDTADLTAIEVWRGSEKLTIVPDDSRWWIEEPADGMAQLGISFRHYNAVYSDRRRLVDGKPWLLADPRAVEKLIYESSQVLVRDIVAQAETSTKMEEWSLNPFWRKIVFHGQGINSDPKSESADEFTIIYGPPLGNDYVPLLRRGNLMLADVMASETLGSPLENWLDTGAMPFRIEVGDSLHMEKEGRWVVSAYPGEDEDISRWVGTIAEQEKLYISKKERLNVIENLILNLDQLEIIQVLPPSQKSEVLLAKEHVGMVFWTSMEGVSGQRKVEFGWLDLDNLPGGDVAKTEELAEEYDGQRPAGLWVPETGQLLQIPGHLVISFRNLGQL